ncbi:MAG: zf-HC2 domain-containing protein [Armatimonadota bacterium]
MVCSDVSNQIAAFLDGELPPDVQEAVQNHLKECPRCQTECESLKRTSNLVKQLPTIQPSDNWDIAFRNKLAASQYKQLAEEFRRLRELAEELTARLVQFEQTELNQNAGQDLMTVEEVAAYLRVSPEKIYEMLDELPYIDLNYELRFRKSSIDQWLRSREVLPSEGLFPWSRWISGSSNALP